MFVATMKAIFHATEMWLLLALGSFGCIFFGGAHDYSNGYWLFTVGCWLVLDISWVLAARHTKSVITGGQSWATLLVTFLVYALYCLPLSSVPLLGQRVLPRLVALQALGALMCMLGAGFAIWSRSVLGRSWSATVTRGDGHCLVQRGPYAIVRHPIYFGFLVAVIGMVLALGEARAFALLFGILILLKKMGREEGILRTAFPSQYLEYEQRVKRLLPWIW
jgi:protein-S-isoprenylcysteine O-methyltransferase Ste14